MKKIGLISDPHASPEPVAEALAIFSQEKVDEIWCTGDIAGYGEELSKTILLLEQSHCDSILGNHEQWYLDENTEQVDPGTKNYLNSLPQIIQKEIEGKRLYMVHASQPDSMIEGIRLLDKTGDLIEEEKQAWTACLARFEHDVLIVGHTHQVFAEKLGNTLVINPGSTCFNHSCAILTLPDLDVQWFSLSDKPIQKSWNWGAGLATNKKEI